MHQRVPATWTTEKASRHAVRLLIEDGDPALAIADFELYRQAGIDVAYCSGPATDDDDDCPVLTGAPCPLHSAADVVLQQLPPDSAVVTATAGLQQPPRIIRVGGPTGDLGRNTPVDSRIRAVLRGGPITTATGGRNDGSPDQA